MTLSWPAHRVEELQEAGVLLVEDGNHGECRPRPHEFGEGETRFIRAADLDQGRVLFEKSSRISDIARDRVRKGVGATGDILFSHKGTVGKLAFVRDAAPPFVCSPQTTFWRVLDHERLRCRFLYYYMLSWAFRSQWQARKGETDMADYVSLTAQRQLAVCLPPLEVQDSIIHVLSSLDDKIELNREMNRTLEALAQSIFRSWFVDFDPVVARAEGREPFGMDADTAALFPDRFVDSELGPIPEGWEVCGVGDIAELHRVMVDPGALAPDTPYVGLEHIPRQAMTLDTWGQASDVMSGKTTFKQGHVLFGKLRPYFHKVVRAPFAGVCSTDVLVIRPVFPEDSGFVLHTAASSAFVAHADAGSSGTRMPRARWEHMQRFRVVRPPKPLSARFSSIASDLIGLAEANTRESLTLTSLRDLLLPKLLSGEIRVPEAAEMVEDVA